MLNLIFVLLASSLFGFVNAEEAPTGEVVVVPAEAPVVEKTRAEKFAAMYEVVEEEPAVEPAICNPDSDVHCAEVSDDIGTWDKVKEIAAATGLKIKVFFVGDS